MEGRTLEICAYIIMQVAFQTDESEYWKKPHELES